ncbi:MAG: glycosyltransferase family 4 protein [candidate division WOR-3 bacterium]
MTGGTRHLDFGIELVKRGYKVYIISSDFNVHKLQHMKLAKDEYYKIENVNGVNFVWVKTFTYKKNDFQRLLNQIIFSVEMYRVGRILEKPDIIIGVSPQLITALSALFLSIKLKKPFISDILDLWPESLIQLKPEMKKNPYTWFLYLLEKIIYQKSKSIIVCVEKFKNHIVSKGIEEKKIHFISNCTYPNHFTPDKPKEYYKEKYKIDKFTIAYTGAIGVANNPYLILDIAKKLEDKPIDFLILGEGPLREDIEKRIKDENIKNVRIYKTIPKRNILNFLANVDLCLITVNKTELYKYGLSPNKLFDYMLAGKPILITAKPEYSEFVKDSGCGFYADPENLDEIVSIIMKVYNMSESEREEMGKRGKDYILKFYSEQSLGDKLEMIIDQTLSEENQIG